MPQNDPVDAHALLGRVLTAHEELRYALMAVSSGEIVCEVGSRAALSYQFADRVAEAETLRGFHKHILDVEKLNDPKFIPQGYGQGECHAVYGRTKSGELVVAIGVMPSDVLAGSPELRAHWIYGFQQRIWKTVSSLFATAA